MSLLSHLHGFPSLSASVGRGGVNNPGDVKSVKALLNPYLRANGQAGLVIDTKADPSFSSLIEIFKSSI